MTVVLRNLTNKELRFDGAGLDLQDYSWGPVTSGDDAVRAVPDAVRFSPAIIRALADGKMSILGTDASTPVVNAYDIAVENGFVGTVDEWLASLVGPQGVEGPQGKWTSMTSEQWAIAVANGMIDEDTLVLIVPDEGQDPGTAMIPVLSAEDGSLWKVRVAPDGSLTTEQVAA